MIKLFVENEYNIIFSLNDVNVKIYCTDFIRFWSFSDKIISFQSSLIEEINNKNNLSFNTQYIEGSIHLRIYKMQTDTIKIKLGEFKLMESNDEKAIEKLFQLIYNEFSLILNKQKVTENSVLELQIENENLRKDFKNLTESTLIRENQILDKACFLINEKKRKINELETDLKNSSCKFPKSNVDNDLRDRNTELDENSSDCHSSLSCSIVENEINADVDGDAVEIEKSTRFDFQSNNSTGNDSESELFPENDSTKLTAVPVKIRSKEHIKETPDNFIQETKEVIQNTKGSSETSNQYLASDFLNDTLVSSDLFNQM